MAQSGRRFPWRETRDPYHVLLAEVLLQRTAAEQVVPVYGRLVRDYPTAPDLAAQPAALAKYFRSTGLPGRARTLVAIGQYITGQLGQPDPEE